MNHAFWCRWGREWVLESDGLGCYFLYLPTMSSTSESQFPLLQNSTYLISWTKEHTKSVLYGSLCLKKIYVSFSLPLIWDYLTLFSTNDVRVNSLGWLYIAKDSDFLDLRMSLLCLGEVTGRVKVICLWKELGNLEARGWKLGPYEWLSITNLNLNQSNNNHHKPQNGTMNLAIIPHQAILTEYL